MFCSVNCLPDVHTLVFFIVKLFTFDRLCNQLFSCTELSLLLTNIIYSNWNNYGLLSNSVIKSIIAFNFVLVLIWSLSLAFLTRYIVHIAFFDKICSLCIFHNIIFTLHFWQDMFTLHFHNTYSHHIFY